MTRFPRSVELDQMLQQGTLLVEQIKSLADSIAKFHQQAASVDVQRSFGSPEAINGPVQENFKQLRTLIGDKGSVDLIKELECWSRAKYQAIYPLIKKRREQGYVRECHGDMHLANMIWLAGKPVLFDCIEFSDNLRWIDVISDTAFLLMDLDDRAESGLGWSFLNRYLQVGGDYHGLALLNFYKSYRAMVRAKVIGIRLSQTGLKVDDRDRERSLLKSYLALAEGYCAEAQPTLMICHGYSGSGKSSFADRLAPLCRAIVLSSDVERKRLYGLAATQDSRSAVSSGIYSPEATKQTYARLRELAHTIICAGFSVIVDATFLQPEQREPMLVLADEQNIPVRILDFHVPETELVQRIEKRSQQTDRVSEADRFVLSRQIEDSKPLTRSERHSCIQIRSHSSAEEIADHMRRVSDSGHTD